MQLLGSYIGNNLFSFSSANLSLHEMRCLYFKLKDKVFTEQLGPIPLSDTETLEEILKNTFGEHRKLGSRKYPKYLYGNISVTAMYVRLLSF